MIPQLTFTGVDEFTDMAALDKLLYGQEVGILVTDSPDGRNRYPSEAWIEQTIAEYKHHPIALHICGVRARTKLLSGYYKSWAIDVKRIQVNGVVTADDLHTICSLYPDQKIITQPGKPENDPLVDLVVADNNHCLLIDGSGGRGISPPEWKSPVATKNVGFAGGLGPDTIVSEFLKIEKIAKEGFWLDMEGNLRTEDKFDISKVKKVLSNLNEHEMRQNLVKWTKK